MFLSQLEHLVFEYGTQYANAKMRGGMKTERMYFDDDKIRHTKKKKNAAVVNW